MLDFKIPNLCGASVNLNAVDQIFDDLIGDVFSNIEAEQALIGSILVSNDIYDEISGIVDAQKFFDPIHMKIYETIENIKK